MVVGEPGIGKTTVTEQLLTYVAMRGGRTLVGHCYEEGSLALPYLPFVEAMRSYALVREKDAAAGGAGHRRGRGRAHRLRDPRPRRRRAAAARQPGGGALPPLPGGDDVPAQRLGGAGALHRARRPAGRRQGHDGAARASRAQPLRHAAADRRYLSRRRGRPPAPALRRARRPAARRELHAHPPARAHTRRSAADALEHRRPGRAIRARGGDLPPDRGQPAVHPGGGALHP